MAMEFAIPTAPAGRPALQEAGGLSPGHVADVLDDLGDHNALYITEDGVYERCEQLARHFTALPPRDRARTVDVLAANLSALCTSASSLLSSAEAADPGAAARHRSSLKMLVHLLHLIAVAAAKDAEAGARGGGGENAPAAASKPKAVGRGRKAAASRADEACNTWDWPSACARMLLAAQGVMRVDLRALFKGLAAAEHMVNLCLELALQAVESAPVLKVDGAWPACREVLVRGALQHQQLDFVSAALLERARKHEHLPPLVGDAAKHAEQDFNSTQLAVKLLTEFCEVSPEDYDAQYATHQASVRLAGDVLTQLAELLPKVVSNHISQLRPYLGCAKAHGLRGALLAATGSVLVQVFPTEALSSGLGAGAAQAHLRSKEALLALLHERVLDKAAVVRIKVLQTWARLVEESCVPLSHWNTLLTQAIGRLEDESQLVVKAALQLLNRMVHQGIFQPPLNPQVYINTLHEAEQKLAVLQPAGARRRGGIGEGGGEEDDQDSELDEAAAQDGADGTCWAQGGIQIEEARDGEDAAMRDADAGGAGAASAADGSDAAGAPGSPGDEAAVTRLRTIIASLKEGASFCRRLNAALPQLQVLLANPAAAVVHDAIIFLTLCKTYDVEGAAKALRGMWPLVFSKHEQVRLAVLDSWHVLHLHDRQPKQQLQELLHHVVPGSSLAELAALEAILGALVAQGNKLHAPLLVRLLVHDVCHYYTRLQEAQAAAQAVACDAAGAPGAASASSSMEVDGGEGCGGEGADAAAAGGGSDAARADYVEHLRRCVALLSLLAAAQPDALDARFVPVLLEVGFSSKLADAWVARHTCLALRHAAPHLVPGAVPLPAAAGHTAVGAAAPAPAPGPGGELPPEVAQAALAGLVRLLVAPPAPTMAPNWPSAAEAAVAALYALSPRPQELMAAVLDELFARCSPGGGGGDAPEACELSAAALARFFFVLGRAALQHLLCIEQLGKAVRAARLVADRAAAEAVERAREAAAAAGGGKRSGRAAAAAAASQAADDISALVGAGAVTADAELDALCDAVEAQVLAKDQLLGRYGGLLSGFCHLRRTLDAPHELQCAALLALSQLMAVDAHYCDANVALLFTLLVKRLVPVPVRVNLVVALADLASRFPNVLEPWTAYMYEPLRDPEPGVRLAALSSLTHLVLGGMVKAKGNVAKVAALLVDDCPELVDRGVLFFESLAASGSGGGRGGAGSAAAGAAGRSNPVYNLLPDCLSALMRDERLREEQLQVIMAQLLGYVKDKQAEALLERLVGRLQLGGPRQWRLVAWCISQLGYSEKGLRRVMELTPCYRHALGEQQVFDVFMALADKARKATGGAKAAAAAAAASVGVAGAGDLRAAVEEWVADLAASREAALEAAEVEALAARQGGADDDGDAAAPQQDLQQAGGGGQDSGANPGDAGGAAAAAGAAQQEAGSEEAADGPAGPAASQAVVEAEQIALVQSQDLAAPEDEDDDEVLAGAGARLQRLSLAGAVQPAGAAARGAASSAAARRPRASAAPAAAAAGRPQRGGGAAGASRRRQPAARRQAAASIDESDDGSSGGDASDEEPAASRPAGGRAAGTAARPAARQRAPAAAPSASEESSSEDDD